MTYAIKQIFYEIEGDGNLKKIAYFIMMIGLIFFSRTVALAGDVPEGFLSEDNAVIFFGEVLSYDINDKHITVLPTKKIKGDIDIEVSQIYKETSFIGWDWLIPVEGAIYLMAKYDENNPLYVFRTTSYDTKTLEIEGITGMGMWERMQEYLNEGAYEQKEAERLKRLEEADVSIDIATTHIANATPSDILISEPTVINASQQDFTNYYLYALIVIVISIVLLVYLRKRNK